MLLFSLVCSRFLKLDFLKFEFSGSIFFRKTSFCPVSGRGKGRFRQSQCCLRLYYIVKVRPHGRDVLLYEKRLHKHTNDSRENLRDTVSAIPGQGKTAGALWRKDKMEAKEIGYFAAIRLWGENSLQKLSLCEKQNSDILHKKFYLV